MPRAAPACRRSPTTPACASRLGGAPGVYSARFAGEPKSDAAQQREADRRTRPANAQPARPLRLRLVFVRHADDPQPIIAEGEWHGEILATPRGDGGFGYDPYVLPARTRRSAAELDAAEKNRRSHRGQAPAATADRTPANRVAEPRRQARRASSRIIPIDAARQGAVAGEPAEFRHRRRWRSTCIFPWCVQKCPYCDFNSHEGARWDSRSRLSRRADRRPGIGAAAGLGPAGVSIFFGGGTPSLLLRRRPRRAADAVRTAAAAPDAEITLEANPGHGRSGKFAGFRAAGVNRLSLGIQSFNPAHLKALGRIHDERRSAARDRNRRRHFDNFNLDLMYGLPGQTLEQALHDIETALAFAPAAPVLLPADARAEHRLRRLPAGTAGRRSLRRHAGRHRSQAGRGPATALRNLGLSPSRPAMPAQPQLLDISATTSASAPARTAS
jgi:hypothetical protein